MEYKGIDVSAFQGDINWPEVANSGINFAMIRATYGTTGIDKTFLKNISDIQSTNIHAGTYHYCYARSAQEAVQEANHFINIVKPYAFSYPLALDLEENSIGQLGKNIVAEIINSFCNTLKEQKYYPMLYTNLNWLKSYIDTSLIPGIDIWLAEWGDELTYNNNVTIWQNSQNGRIPGINGNVDLNISFKDYPTIIKDLGLNNTSNTAPEPNPNPSFSQYVVKSGDTLWDIAKLFLGDATRYKEIMSLNGLTSDRIYPGQILKIPTNNSNQQILYTVKKGNTLWGIAKQFLGNGTEYKKIMEANGLTTDIIYPGQILKIPTM